MKNYTGLTTDENDSEMSLPGTCIERKDPTVVILSFIPLIGLLLNITVLVAVTLYRSKLRQNNVYIYVFSVLLSNILFNTLSMYQVFNHYHQFEGDPTAGSSAIRNWWVFRKALLVSTYLIMVANIGGLIYAIRSGNYIIAKAANPQACIGDESAVSSIQNQRKRAKAIVSLAWCIPLTLALLTLTGWNCSETCKCLSGCYTLENMEKTPMRSCSRVISALSNSYMGITAVIWIIEIATLFFMICKTFSQSVLLSAGCMKTSLARKESVDGEESDKQGGTLEKDDGLPSRPQFKRESSHEVEKPRPRKMSRRSRVDRRHRRYARWLRLASKQLAYLTVLFFVCTAPAMVCLTVDIFSKEATSSTTNSVLISVPVVYSIICPIVLAKDLAGLKSALVSLLLKIFPGKKTKFLSGTNTSSTMSDTEKGQNELSGDRSTTTQNKSTTNHRLQVNKNCTETNLAK